MDGESCGNYLTCLRTTLADLEKQHANASTTESRTILAAQISTLTSELRLLGEGPDHVSKLQLLRHALDAIWAQAAASALPAAQQAAFRMKMTRSLLDALEAGERDPESLRQAALKGVGERARVGRRFHCRSPSMGTAPRQGASRIVGF